MRCVVVPARPRLQPAVLLCLIDVSQALEYMHSIDIVHGEWQQI